MKRTTFIGKPLLLVSEDSFTGIIIPEDVTDSPIHVGMVFFCFLIMDRVLDCCMAFLMNGVIRATRRNVSTAL